MIVVGNQKKEEVNKGREQEGDRRGVEGRRATCRRRGARRGDKAQEVIS